MSVIILGLHSHLTFWGLTIFLKKKTDKVSRRNAFSYLCTCYMTTRRLSSLYGLPAPLVFLGWAIPILLCSIYWWVSEASERRQYWYRCKGVNVRNVEKLSRIDSGNGNRSKIPEMVGLLNILLKFRSSETYGQYWYHWKSINVETPLGFIFYVWDAVSHTGVLNKVTAAKRPKAKWLSTNKEFWRELWPKFISKFRFAVARGTLVLSTGYQVFRLKFAMS